MQYRTFFLLIIFTASLIFSEDVSAQGGRNYYKIDDSEFPKMKIQMVGRDGIGSNLHLENEYFELSENGMDLSSTISIDSTRKPDTPSVSVLLLLDCSQSFVGEPLDWLKQGVTAFLDSLKFVGETKVRILTFANECLNPSWKPGWQTDPKILKETVDALITRPGATNFKKVLYDGTQLDPIAILKNETPEDVQRHLIFVSDGPQNPVYLKSAESVEIAQRCRDAQIFFHSISIKEKEDFEITDICKNTGGYQFTVKTINEVLHYFRYLAGNPQLRNYYQLTWESTYGCAESERIRNLVIKWWNPAHSSIFKTYNRTFTAPEKSVAKVNMSDEKIYFGIPGSDTVKTLKITCDAPDFTLDGADFEPSGVFKILNWGGANPPFLMKKGDSRNITLTYANGRPDESEEVTMNFNSADFICDIPDVTLVSLCNSEAGDDTDLGEVEMKLNESKKIACAFKNLSASAINVEVSIQGNSDFSITSGSGAQTVDAGDCLDITVKFMPSKVGAAEATVMITAPEDCGGEHSFKVTAEGIPSGVFDPSPVEKGIKMTVDPNPAEEMINIKLNSEGFGKYNLELYNAVGNLVRAFSADGPQLSANISDMPSGIYFLRVQRGSKYAVSRILISR